MPQCPYCQQLNALCTFCQARLFELVAGPQARAIRRVAHFLHTVADDARLDNARREFETALARIPVESLRSSSPHVAVEITIRHAYLAARQRYDQQVSLDAPAAEFLMLLRTAITRRRYHRHCLRRFHFDVRRGIFRGHYTLSRAEIEAFLHHILGYQQYEWLFQSGMLAVGKAQREWKDPQSTIRAAVVAMRETLFDGLGRQAGALTGVPISASQEWSICMLAGWVGAEISLKDNPRLAAVLRKELTTRGEHSCSTYDELYKRLPANAYRAWHEGDWETQAQLRTRIAYLVEHDVSEQSPQVFCPDEPSQAAPALPDNPTYEAVARRLEEEDQYINWLIKTAGLTSLEEQVTRLQLQEPPDEHPDDHYSDQEIADMLGRSLGSIKQAWLRARPKLQRVINQ